MNVAITLICLAIGLLGTVALILYQASLGLARIFIIAIILFAYLKFFTGMSDMVSRPTASSSRDARLAGGLVYLIIAVSVISAGIQIAVKYDFVSYLAKLFHH